MLLETIRQSFLEAGEPGSLLIGISGGGDSVALLISLYEFSKERPVRIHAVHVNHGLRDGADDDEAFVRQLCTDHSIPLLVFHVNVARAGSLEAAAREARYSAFAEASAKFGTEMLVLAHHAGDQAETILMHLFRGAGSAGLGGMDVCNKGVWRPLLGLSKEFLRACLVEKNIAWREDPTNNNPEYFRNNLRINIMPIINRIAPQAVMSMCRSAAILRDETAYFQAYAKEWLKHNANITPPCRFLLSAPLLAEHIAVQRHVLRVFCEGVSGPLTMEQTDRLRFCLAGKTGGIINISSGTRVLRTRDRLHILPFKTERVQSGLWKMEALPFSGDLGDGIRRQAFDADVLHGAELRIRRPGDRITPLGSQGSQTLKQYMIDRHIDQPFRGHWPCLVKGNTVLWVIGIGMAQTAAISETSKNKTMLHYVGRLPDEIN